MTSSNLLDPGVIDKEKKNSFESLQPDLVAQYISLHHYELFLSYSAVITDNNRWIQLN